MSNSIKKNRYSTQEQHSCKPGIFVLECLPLKRAYFGAAKIAAFFELQDFFQLLQQGICENKELLRDFKTYGSDNFFGALVVTSPDYFDEKKLAEALQKAKSEWPDSLY